MKAKWVIAITLLAIQPAHAYSVLTHEAIIDSLWLGTITPLLKTRFPGATADDLVRAHAFAYGGAIIQDVGYYPFGSTLFSELTHYVRSGDFVLALIRDAQTSDEYAFALGALAHYIADTSGHPEAVNLAVAMLYPKLKAKFGQRITFDDAPGAHLKTEFGFDVLQLAKARYAPEAYHDFVGFKVSKRVLDQAFADTYSLELKDVFSSVDLALGTYRWTVSSLIPEMTKVAWRLKRREIEASQPGITERKFLYNLSRSSFEREWGNEHERPGCFARLLAALFRIVPKVGPFKALAYRMPDADAEKLFMASFNDTLERYRSLSKEVAHAALHLEDRNLDTGRVTQRGAYKSADETYQELLEKLADRQSGIGPGLRENILHFYGKFDAIRSVKARDKLASLRQTPAQ